MNVTAGNHNATYTSEDVYKEICRTIPSNLCCKPTMLGWEIRERKGVASKVIARVLISVKEVNVPENAEPEWLGTLKRRLSILTQKKIHTNFGCDSFIPPITKGKNKKE